jgi:TATA-box binding protein (TBP) (component of TFIID and TFIIIB)
MIKRDFSAAIKRIKDPKCTILIFNNGKLIITGCKTEDQCIFVSQKISKFIQNLGYYVNIAEKSVKNIVGSIDYGSKISSVYVEFLTCESTTTSTNSSNLAKYKQLLILKMSFYLKKRI